MPQSTCCKPPNDLLGKLDSKSMGKAEGNSCAVFKPTSPDTQYPTYSDQDPMDLISDQRYRSVLTQYTQTHGVLSIRVDRTPKTCPVIFRLSYCSSECFQTETLLLARRRLWLRVLGYTPRVPYLSPAANINFMSGRTTGKVNNQPL